MTVSVGSLPHWLGSSSEPWWTHSLVQVKSRATVLDAAFFFPLLLLFIFYSMKNNFHGLVTCSRLLIYHDKDEAFSPSSSEFLIYHRFTVQRFHTSAALCVTAWLPVFHLTFTDGKHASPGGNNPCMHAIIQTLSHQHQFSSSFYFILFYF